MAKEIFPFRDEDTKFAVLKHSVTSTKTSLKTNKHNEILKPPCIVCGHSYSFENERVSNNLVSRLLLVQTKGLHALIMDMNDIVNLGLKLLKLPCHSCP